MKGFKLEICCDWQPTQMTSESMHWDSSIQINKKNQKPINTKNQKPIVSNQKPDIHLPYWLF